MRVCVLRRVQHSCSHQWFFDIFTRNSILYKGPAFTKSRPATLHTYLQCNFNVFIFMICFVFSKLHKMRTHRSQLDTLHGARVHETSLCVASAASRFGTNSRAVLSSSRFASRFGTNSRPVSVPFRVPFKIRYVFHHVWHACPPNPKCA